MIPELYTEIAINRDLADLSLKKGDIAVFIEHLKHPSEGEDGAILEIFNALGDSLGIVTVPISAIEPLRAEFRPAVRMA
jgi:hypothetical protein